MGANISLSANNVHVRGLSLAPRTNSCRDRNWLQFADWSGYAVQEFDGSAQVCWPDCAQLLRSATLIDFSGAHVVYCLLSCAQIQSHSVLFHIRVSMKQVTGLILLSVTIPTESYIGRRNSVTGGVHEDRFQSRNQASR